MKLTKYFTDEFVSNRLVMAVFSACVFVGMGWVIPAVYFNYLDNTLYYTVVQPIPVDRKYYKPCDNVIVTATRSSSIDSIGDVLVDLSLKKSDGTLVKIENAKIRRQAAIHQGKNVTVSVEYPLPCTLDSGLYFWQIAVDYHVHNVLHEYTAISETFNVNKQGVDPAILKIASDAAKLKPTVTPVSFNTFNTNYAGSSGVPVINITSVPAQSNGNQQSVPQNGSTGGGTGSTTTINNIQQPQPTAKPVPTPTPQVGIIRGILNLL